MIRTNRRRSAALTLAGALGALVLLLVPSALARSPSSGAGGCPSGKSSHHAAHSTTRRCPKRRRRSAKRRHSTHKPTGKRTKTIALIPATCEDETLPVRGADGAYACDDGSEPSCEDGVGATLSAKTGAPMCVPAAEATSLEASLLACAGESGECASEEAVCETEGVEGSTPDCEVIAEETGDDGESS